MYSTSLLPNYQVVIIVSRDMCFLNAYFLSSCMDLLYKDRFVDLLYAD